MDGNIRTLASNAIIIGAGLGAGMLYNRHYNPDKPHRIIAPAIFITLFYAAAIYMDMRAWNNAFKPIQGPITPAFEENT